MAENRAIHEFSTGIPDNGSLFLVDTPDQSAESGYTTEKLPMTDVGSKLVNGIQYTQDLQTRAKTITGAINELASGGGGASWTDLTDTLTAGNTSLTISDASILATSTIDIYTDTYGVNPTAVSVSAGSITLTFEAQASDISVKVRIS